jgi:hypothetical protein
MFTQSMPALAQALSGALPDGAVRQLMQALGNCQQPLTHRGAVNVQPPGLPTRGGLARGGTWRPSDYKNLLPTAGSGGYVDVPGGGGGSGGGDVNNSHNYDGNGFFFPTDLGFEYTDYYGGDTFNVAGNSSFDYSTHSTVNAGDVNTNSLRVNYINNTYVGDPGQDGRDGRPGRDGGGGAFGPIVFGPGGGGFGPQLPAATDVKTFMKSVGVTATAKIDGYTGGKLADDFKAEPQTEDKVKTFTVTGSLNAPIISSAKLENIEADGKATIPTVTGGTVSGITASGTAKYDTFPSGTLADLSGSVTVPTVSSASMEASSSNVSISYDAFPTATVTAGAAATVKVPVVDSAKWTGSITGIAVSGGLGTLSGTVPVPVVSKATWAGSITGIAASGNLGNLSGSVTIPIVTGGYLDASCKFVPTTSNQTFTINLAGAPGASITSQGTVAGTVTLTSGEENRTVTLAGAPTASVTSQGTVAGTVALSSTDQTYTVTTPTPTVTLNKETRTASATVSIPASKISLSASTQACSFTLTGGKVTNTKSEGSASVSISVTGGTLTPTTGSTDVAVKVSAANANVSLTKGTQATPFSADGEITVKEVTGVKFVGSTAIKMTAGTLVNKVTVKTAPKSDFIVYLRPRA